MNIEQQYKDAVTKGSLLKIYVQELRQNLKAIYNTSLMHRNPYYHTKQAKENVQAVLDSFQHLQDTIFLYMAALAKVKLYTKQEMHAYFYVYQFLFEFQDEIKRQEWIHCLLIKKQDSIEKIEAFMNYTNEFVDNMEHSINKKSKVYGESQDRNEGSSS